MIGQLYGEIMSDEVAVAYLTLPVSYWIFKP
jgi:hypothetical protein